MIYYATYSNIFGVQKLRTLMILSFLDTYVMAISSTAAVRSWSLLFVMTFASIGQITLWFGLFIYMLIQRENCTLPIIPAF